MNRFAPKLALSICIVLGFNISLIVHVKAEVPYTYWTPNGVVLDTTADNDEVNHHTIVSDGAGGAFVAWIRSYFVSGDTEVFVQKVNASGQAQWTAGGVGVTTLGEIQTEPEMVLDGAGGVIVSWLQYDGVSQSEVYVQKLNSAGVVQWGDGVSVTQSLATNKNHQQIVSDGAGGALVTWDENRDAFLDIFAQRIDTSGNRDWNAEGEAVYQDTVSNILQYKMTSDGSGGLIAAWSQTRAADTNLYGQRLNSSGAQQWAATGAVINDETGTQFVYGLVSDSAGGAIVMWEDERTDRDVYVQRVNASGALQWNATGVAVSPLANISFALDNAIASDGANGAFVAWHDTDDAHLEAQRITSAGSLAWDAAGVSMVSDSYASTVSMITTNTSDLIAVWDHNTTVGPDEFIMINAQYVDATGDVKWGANGLSIYGGHAYNSENKPLIVNDGDIGGIVVWSPDDETTGNYYQVKVQGVTHAYQIANLDAALDSVDETGNNIEVGTANGLVGNDELVRITKDADNTIISDVLTDMVSDHDWSVVNGENDLTAGKAVVTGLESAPGTAGVHTLYVPFVSGHNQLVICPDATLLSEVTTGCSNQVRFAEGETKAVGSDSVTVSKVTINSQIYWAAAGVSGTGGFSTTAAQLPATGTDQQALIVVAMLLISLGSLGAVKVLRREA